MVLARKGVLEKWYSRGQDCVKVVSLKGIVEKARTQSRSRGVWEKGRTMKNDSEVCGQC